MPPPNTFLKNLLTATSAFFSGLCNKPKEERRKGEKEKGESQFCDPLENMKIRKNRASNLLFNP